MRNIILSLVMLFVTATAFGSSKWINQSNAVLGVKSEVKCSTGLTCTVVNGKINIAVTGAQSGFLQTQSGTSTVDAGDLSSSYCGGTIVGGYATTVVLPEASTVLGCRFTFVSTSQPSIVDPADTSDQILGLTNAAGDSITNATNGNSVVLEAVGANSWAPVAIYGTWSDSN